MPMGQYGGGSKKTTHKTMNMKSNVKGVKVTPTMVTPQVAKTDGGAHIMKGTMPKSTQKKNI